MSPSPYVMLAFIPKPPLLPPFSTHALHNSSVFISLRTRRSTFTPTLTPKRTRIRCVPPLTHASLSAEATNPSSDISLRSITSAFPTPLTPPTAPRTPTTRFLIHLCSQWRYLVPALIAALIGSLCAVCVPILYGRIVSLLATTAALNPSVARARLFSNVSYIGIAFAIEAVMTFCFVSLAARAIDRATRILRERLFQRTLRNDVGYFDNTGRSQIERTIATEIKSVRDTLWANLSKDRGIRAIVEVVLGVIISISITGIIGLPIYGFLVPVLAITTSRIGMRCGKMAFLAEKEESDVRFFIGERLSGLRILKAFGAENKEARALGGMLDKAEASAKTFTLSRAIAESASRASIYTTIVSYMLTGGLLICSGRLTYELFACLTGYIWSMNFGMSGISYTLTDTAKISNSLKTIYSVLDGASEYASDSSKVINLPKPVPKFRGEIQFQNVSFSYPSRSEVQVIKGINFTIKQGQILALVGESGGGKSTIAAVLGRLYAATTGCVTLDGMDIQSIPADVYANQISLVDQDPILFQGTIRDNIAYGLPDQVVDDETIIQAAKEANAHEFITNLPNGYDTIWTPASNLSGGQRQRIAIARSLVKSPRIMILDEPTSSLDQESERQVHSALMRIMEKRTVILIAHRLATVKPANEILFVKSGQVVERGTYEQLISKENGYFRALARSGTDSANSISPRI